MTVLEFSALLFGVSLVAGFLGSLTGLGGGVVLVPVLTLLLGVDIRYAIGTSLVSVIATSSGAAAAYVKEGFTNIRIGMFLEMATSAGAIVGAFLATITHTWLIAVIFGVSLLFSALHSLPKGDAPRNPPQDPDEFSRVLKLTGDFPEGDGVRHYAAQRAPFGFLVMMVAGVLSGLLGIGSGALKVVGMDNVMRLPFKVSTTTSNFMIGVTAAASAGIYLSRGYIDPGLSMPVMLGVLVGSLSGARILPTARVKYLRWVFAATIVVLGTEMLYNGVTHRI
jgi:uncharacterized membrane protein YfcA